MARLGEQMNICTKSDLENAIEGKYNEIIDIIDCEISIYELAYDNQAAIQKLRKIIHMAGQLDRKYQESDKLRHTKESPHKAVAILINASEANTNFASFPKYELAMNSLYLNLRKLTDYVNPAKVWLIIENPSQKLLISPMEIRHLIDRLNSPWLGIYLNAGNIKNSLSESDYIDILAGRLFNTQ